MLIFFNAITLQRASSIEQPQTTKEADASAKGHQPSVTYYSKLAHGLMNTVALGTELQDTCDPKNLVTSSDLTNTTV